MNVKSIFKFKFKYSAVKNQKHIEIDKSWTEQHVSNAIAYPYVLASDSIIGFKNTQTILNELKIPIEYFEDQTLWISSKFFDEFFDRFSKFGSKAGLAKKAAEIAFKLDSLNTRYWLFDLFKSNLELMGRSFERLQFFNKTRTCDVTEVSKNRLILEVKPKNRKIVSKHREICENWVASFENLNIKYTGNPGVVKKTGCIFNGDRSCEYDISWSFGYRTVLNVIKNNLLVV